VLGLEVVLPDGRLLSSLTALRKDNTGYDLRGLFVGAEGTLGVITAASLKLFPAAHDSVTALVAIADFAAAIALLARLREASGDRLSSFEILPAVALDLVLAHIPETQRPLQSAAPWYVLLETTSPVPNDRNLRDSLEAALGAALESEAIVDAVIAQSTRESAALWKLRESIPEAQRRDGASLKHDVALPLSALPAFHAAAAAWVGANVPEGVLVAYGHVGDGNLHFNISQARGASREAFLAREPAAKRAIHDLVRAHAGSFSAEHGIGRLKVEELERYADPTELDLMRSLKRTLDPNGIMNPGKVLRRAS
jgi:FAD/FMN-containing dehydrogenase